MAGNIIPNKDTENFIKKYVHISTNKDLKLTSIIILTHNQLAYTKLCIESIRKFTHKESYEIIVVDNNSTDDTVNWLKKQRDLTVIYNDENKGFPAGCNQGIKVAKGENILLLNNDVIVTPNWLNNLQKALYSDEKVGIVGAISNSCSNYQQVEVNYNDILQMINFATQVNISNPISWDERHKLIGFCYLIKREVIDKVGLLDEQFTPGNFEDDDFSLRTACQGYKHLLCKDVFVHHFGSVSFKSKGQEFSHVFYDNLAKFNRKWKFNSQYSGGMRLDILNQINNPPESKLNVLDIGCGLGCTLLELKNRYKGSNIYGIEIDENVGNITKNILPTIVGNVENLELPYEENYFDYIILGDVLEHLIDPWETLRKIRKYLKKDGAIIASIPNIMHIDVLTEIIRGGFSYVDAGILDKTHLRFFTLAEIQKLFESTEYKIESVNAIATQPNEEQQKVINALATISNSQIKDQYLVYQYIVKSTLNIPIPKYEQDTMLDFKFKLMRLDNDLDIENSLNGIINLYINDKENFITDFNILIEDAVIDKQKVIDLVANAASKRGLNDLYQLLQ